MLRDFYISRCAKAGFYCFFLQVRPSLFILRIFFWPVTIFLWVLSYFDCHFVSFCVIFSYMWPNIMIFDSCHFRFSNLICRIKRLSLVVTTSFKVWLIGKTPNTRRFAISGFFFGWLNRCMCICMCNAIISVRHVLSLSHFSNGETSGQIIQPEFDDLDSPPASLTLEGTYRAGWYGLRQDGTVSFFLISLPGIGNYDLSSAEKNRYNIMSILKKLFEIKNSQTFADFLRLVNVIWRLSCYPSYPFYHFIICHSVSFSGPFLKPK